ncbi:PDR/VanB family oxidoreductase [Paenarthrobacter ureafaciens]|jgi:vanillate O-demethylase ferredoxin subunit|uniref:PDR/VanB family oxidoreductase n=1 Tax=Paenarthrobacter ureafaciens TaxID=37931 RepID=UPI00140A28B4|nr:PDR/VanB family oxidoreductase [Paenarthrobacter ureafaciens]MCX8456581.1 PDR/VanB family oxidoreductase [Paenarthrobacter ureafaciens]MCY0974215.1 PDR/VanB family oxidoreductase [Paenarthrobacter ureafaciens]UOD81109.1 PDR/VanB family oxidoreductase [Paenarthrobacter ureafaciens]
MAATNNEVWQSATVKAVMEVAAGIRRIELEPSAPKHAEPGSHIDLVVTINGEKEKRSYSVVESKDLGKTLVISVFQAPVSRGGSVYMHSLKPGDILRITQPLQNFPLRVGAERYVLLAGGIGITAIKNMAAVLRNVKADYTLIYAGRSRAAMAYLQDLQDIHGSRLQVHVDDEGSSLDVNALLSGIDPGTELYMCGPIRLMDAVRRGWTERQLALPDLRYETFGNSGWYDPEEFLVRIPRLGIEARVGQGRSMLEALEDVGVDMMFDCRKGECGLCEVRILNLNGAIDHRDVFYSERQQHAEKKMCCCVSRAVSSATGSRDGTKLSDTPAVITIDVS